ncbi:KEOPS complex subunit Cgi121 [Halorubrum vacuolatum]|uniref:KEOPS complex subunit Cgi121 n=1 Tax=Halorubrum vacuolatum TaxID=63740 RepID=A0A238WFF4_HALVU|nr:KEOPS complex subunit Cgi121 [Halorubrum vacuolatum]SNR45312.1 KEOPS complex subunit Cgi121 [Halorubrum vacuolatum]
MIDAGTPSLDASTPDPSVRIISGTAAVDDLDEFLGSIREITDETGAVIQAFDADLIVSEETLRLATRLAARAIARDEAVARDPAVEILLYAAGRRQIDQALRLGVPEGRSDVIVVVADFGKVPRAERPDADLTAAVERVETLLVDAHGRDSTETSRRFDSEAVTDWYSITEHEIGATAGDLEAIVHERIALLDVEK